MLLLSLIPCPAFPSRVLTTVDPQAVRLVGMASSLITLLASSLPGSLPRPRPRIRTDRPVRRETSYITLLTVTLKPLDPTRRLFRPLKLLQ